MQGREEERDEVTRQQNVCVGGGDGDDRTGEKVRGDSEEEGGGLERKLRKRTTRGKGWPRRKERGRSLRVTEGGWRLERERIREQGQASGWHGSCQETVSVTILLNWIQLKGKTLWWPEVAAAAGSHGVGLAHSQVLALN